MLNPSLKMILMYLAFVVFYPNAATVTAAPSSSAMKGNIAKLCASCHESKDGVMMGFLDNIALKSKTIQMNLLSHKDVVKFSDNTKIKYLDSFADMRNYKGKGFQINFTERKGEKLANEIIRFDILKVISEGKYKVGKLDLQQFEEMRETPGVVVYDVRPPIKYKEAHVQGAKPLPAPAFAKFKSKLPQDKSTPIVLYGVGGCLSPTVAFNLKQMKYENVSIFTKGFPAWSKVHFSNTAPDWLHMAINKDIPHVLIDLRKEADVNGGHIQGAVNIEMANLINHKDAFPSQKNAPIIFYGPGKEEAASRSVSWGYKKSRVLPISFSQWQEANFPVSHGKVTEVISYSPKPKPGTVASHDFQATANTVDSSKMLIDVRNPDEFKLAAVPNSVNIPVDRIASEAGSLPSNKQIYLYCQTGTRAEMAHTILQEQGIDSQYLDALITIHSNGSFDIEDK